MHGNKTPIHGSATPMYGSQTPLHDGSRTPLYGSMTPRGDHGGMTPSQSAWDPSSATPSHEKQFDYGVDFDSPSPVRHGLPAGGDIRTSVDRV